MTGADPLDPARLTAALDQALADLEDMTDQRDALHVGAHVIPGACAHGFPQVVGPWCCSTGWPPSVSIGDARVACSVGSWGRS